MTPIRIQRRRSKGWRLPENTKSVTRPGRWGNPFTVVPVRNGTTMTWRVRDRGGITIEICSDESEAKRACVEIYKDWLPTSGLPIHELRGWNLACWCRIGDWCHSEPLLEAANREDTP